MTDHPHAFDQAYWDQHWERPSADDRMPVNPYLVRETRDLTPGTALDAGCGVGTEAIWLARQGWQVTGADISATALTTARDHAETAGVTDRASFLQADLGTTDPARVWDLVVSHYAHPAIPQLDFYRRLSGWVVAGGTLLIVGHRHGPGGHGPDTHGGDTHGGDHGHDTHPPAEATATPEGITELLAGGHWRIDTAREADRALPGRGHVLRDVVVRATRLR